MDTYSMSQVEVLTGISAHKLRIWERRYGFMNAMRTKTNIRFYTDQQLKKLLNVGILSRNGIRISKIAQMSDAEIHQNVSNILSNNNSEHQDEINALIIQMMEFNEQEFQIIFQRCIIRKGFLVTILEVIYPFLNQIGIIWGINKLIAIQEHFISNLIRQKIITAIDNLPLPQEDAPSIALFLLDNEDHELGLLLSYYIAKSSGWQVYYLGNRVPLQEVGIIREKIKPDLMLTLLILPKNAVETEKTLRTFQSNRNIPILISGGSFTEELSNKCDHCIHMKNPHDLINYLDNRMIELNGSVSA